ncbi:porin [Luteolibacter sp. SL250]|uniref:porin n=1 Tax=Luteolibacter sp. SL250 TaxID=2995170 RepID=UPI00227129CA|nr:porin [Luteolibacter sp. SL250]WAC20662.1 porin [Luteolibacter sp. SL250]
MKSIPRVLLATGLLATGAVHAQDQGVFSAGLTGETTYDKIWSAVTLYKDSSNPILQEFSLQGRLQVQSIYGEADGDSYNTSDWKGGNGTANDLKTWGNDIEVRRAYLGFKSKWFSSVKLEGQIDINTDGRDLQGNDPYYGDIYDLYAVYGTTDQFNVGIGKQELKITREQEISSKEIVTFERSLVANMLHPGNLTGVWVTGKNVADHWLYEVAVYGADQAREFSGFGHGALYFGKIGYDYSAQSGLDTAVVSFRYTHNSNPGFQSDKNDGWFGQPTSPAFTDTLSLSNEIQSGRFGLTVDMNYGFGFSGQADRNGNSSVNVNQSDVFGLTIIPTYFIAPGLQLVGRLQFATSADPDGIQVGSRYERLAASGTGARGRGNTYTAQYVGLNWYLYGHKLKVMNGIEFSQLGGGDYDGYTAMTGLRMAF